MKEDENTPTISQDFLYLACKSAELFAASLAKESFEFAKYERRKTVNYRDVVRAVREIESMDFLSEIVPVLVPAKVAVEERKKAMEETGAPAWAKAEEDAAPETVEAASTTV